MSSTNNKNFVCNETIGYTVETGFFLHPICTKNCQKNTLLNVLKTLIFTDTIVKKLSVKKSGFNCSTKYVFQNTPVRCVAATTYISPSFANSVLDIFNTKHSRSEGVVKCGLGQPIHAHG